MKNYYSEIGNSLFPNNTNSIKQIPYFIDGGYDSFTHDPIFNLKMDYSSHSSLSFSSSSSSLSNSADDNSYAISMKRPFLKSFVFSKKDEIKNYLSLEMLIYQYSSNIFNHLFHWFSSYFSSQIKIDSSTLDYLFPRSLNLYFNKYSYMFNFCFYYNYFNFI
jgi:hypothetical protein